MILKLLRRLFNRPTSNPVKFITWRSTKNGQFYTRITRSGRNVFDGAEGYHNRLDATDAVAHTIEAIQAGNYTTEVQR